MTTDTAAALASALPAGISYDLTPEVRWRYMDIARLQADRLAEQGWVLVRPNDEDTVERVARALSKHHLTTPVQCACGWRETDLGAGRWSEHAAVAALAVLAARPGIDDTEQAEVDRG